MLLRSLVLTALALGCRPSESAEPPGFEGLVNGFLEGDYALVMRRCPVELGESGIDPALSEWCLIGLPAARRLALDTRGARAFVEAVCLDAPTGRPRGEVGLREFYVREIARWLGLALRAQGREATLNEAVDATVVEFSALCRVEAGAVRQGLDTQIEEPGFRRVGARRR